jgi:hypothetical protein
LEVLVRRIAILLLSGAAAITIWLAAATGDTAEAEPSVTIYDANPSHLWNRLYATLVVRQDKHGVRYGEDSVDLMLWGETEHLLSQPSHQRAIQVLDEFLTTHGEMLIRDPLKRAMFERDLWAVFDWSIAQFPARGRPTYAKEKQELQVRLAEVLRRIALTPDEMKALPDTYAQAVASGALPREYDPAHREQTFLPPDLFDPHGPWVGISPSPESDAGVAKVHIFSVSGRSSFLVFVRLPGGRKATMDYFQSLWNFPESYVQGPSFADDQALVNPTLPSFPAGTEVALVRRMNLFDNQGELTATPIVESVQLRVYHTITANPEHYIGGNRAENAKLSGQDFFEIRLSRLLLFSHKDGGLRATSRDEKELSTFEQFGNDEIDELAEKPEFKKMWAPVVETCTSCHSGGGVRSLNSREALLRPNRKQVEPKNSDYGSIYWGDSSAIDWKKNRYDWGVLNGYWKAASPPH